MANRADLLAGYDFELDTFQLDAVDALDAGQHVIVAAPTGSGKTVVAEYGIGAAVADGQRAFYTAPIKALSNQKYRDLLERHGDGQVGLLTGDNSINGDAPIVVMTTEVLRNMLYGRRDLSDLALVVLDEVHFLQDAYRGPVWEEVIIHLPSHVQLVCLSATVSNTEELAEWIETVRGPTSPIVETRRPVSLDNAYLVADRTNDRLRWFPTLHGGRPNPEAARFDASGRRSTRQRHGRRKGSADHQRRLATPTRPETLDELIERRLTPTIWFIFSRAQCDEAARSCVAAGYRLLDDDERARALRIVDDRLSTFGDDDLEALGAQQFIRQIEAGIAAHHAGMVPAFKEVVEQCFIAGLVKVVFATETLAVGINMPARTVVIEKLTKFTGDHHESLTAGQYTQLTGRAGRRGIDEQGSAVVLWSPFVRFDEVADLANSSSFYLRSAFRPTYNMVANLIRSHEAEAARQLLTLSFAQFQADREVVKLERRLQRRRLRLESLRATAESPYGDLDDFRRLVDSQAGAAVRDDPTELALARLRPGDVIHVSKGTDHGPAAVVATASRSQGLRVTVITPRGKALQLLGADFDLPPKAIGSIVLPGSYAPNRQDYRRVVGDRVRQAKLVPKQQRDQVASSGAVHPVQDDPDLRERLKAAAEADRVEREITTLEQRVGRQNSSLAHQFDGVLQVLDDRGMFDRSSWTLTESGDMIGKVFHESDLLVVEALRSGEMDGIDAATLAGLVSTFVYEHRGADEPPLPWFPSGDVRRRWRAIAGLSDALAHDEAVHGLVQHRAPDPGFFAVAYAWVAGEGFAELVEDEELTGGDFVRTMKQLIDLLRQIAIVAPSAETRAVARAASETAFRGVIADASEIVAT